MYSIINKFFFWYNWVWWLPISKEHVYCGFELHEMAPFLPRVLRYQAVRRYRMDPDFLCKLIGAFPNQECVICLNLKKNTLFFMEFVLNFTPSRTAQILFLFSFFFFFWGEGGISNMETGALFFSKTKQDLFF